MKTIMNFILKIFELLKSDPEISIAKYLIGVGLATNGIGSIIYYYQDNSSQHILSYSSGFDITGYILIFVGLAILIRRYFTMKNNAVTLAYGIGIENMDIHIPIQAVPKYERFDCIKINLATINSYDRDKVIDNYKFNKTLIEQRIQNKHSKKVYIGALGSFPYLFLLGTLFRNAYSNIVILDYDRHAQGGGKWYKLPSMNESNLKICHELMYSEMSIEDKINELNNSSSDEVGIALSYTFTVNKEAIPSQLQSNTLYLKNSLGIGHDKLTNEEAQKALLNELSVYIATLWYQHKKVHLFVSAQSSMYINMGKSYMNNAHGVLVLHNYDNASKTYNWCIEFDKGNITH